MTQALTRSFVGKGRFWLQAAGAKLYELGNVDKCTFTAKVDTDKVGDYTKGGGGVAATYSAISDANFALSLTDFNAKNLALALFGESTAQGASTVTDEAVVANLGGLVPLAKAGATAHVVKHTSGTPTYVLDTDYNVTGAGIIIKTGGAITDDQALKVSYSYPAQTSIQALLNSGQEFRLVIDGLNDADSGKAHVIEAYRWKPDPSGFDVLGDKLGRLQIAGMVLADATKTGTGVSKYLRMQQVD